MGVVGFAKCCLAHINSHCSPRRKLLCDAVWLAGYKMLRMAGRRILRVSLENEQSRLNTKFSSSAYGMMLTVLLVSN